VGSFVFDSAGQHHHHRLDGNCRGSQETRLVEILLIVPVANIIVPGYLAWSD